MRIAPLPICAVLASASCAPAPPPAVPQFFYALDDCLPLGATPILRSGDHLTVLRANMPPATIEIARVLSKDDAKQCVGRFDGEPPGPAAYARLELTPTLRDGVLFALRPNGERRIVVGPARRLSAEDAEHVRRTVGAALPGVWTGNDVLVHAYRYGTGRPDIIELYLGRPSLNDPGTTPPIRSIAVRRSYIVDGRELAVEELTRESGVEERVDTEAPQLDADNWSKSDTETTVAFVSERDGGPWMRLSTNIGAEGIWWNAHQLRPGLPLVFEHYLYTVH